VLALTFVPKSDERRDSLETGIVFGMKKELAALNPADV
jgi:hypothetical protein